MIIDLEVREGKIMGILKTGGEMAEGDKEFTRTKNQVTEGQRTTAAFHTTRKMERSQRRIGEIAQKITLAGIVETN